MKRPDVAAGSPVIRLIGQCFQANLPVLLIGSYGIGKSELLAEAARQLAVELITRDLSLMDPTDLLGIPRVNSQSRTVYAPPAFLPSGGRGILLIEELNRAPAYMRAPCLELLTSRRLHDYVLPEGWLPVGAINPPEGDFQVDGLDPALAARFLQVRVKPVAAEWVRWARSQPLHPAVIDFVEITPGVFEDPQANPRAWSYVSRFLSAWEQTAAGQRCDLLPGLAGLVGPQWAEAFRQFTESHERPFSGEQVARSYSFLRGIVKRRVAHRQLDLIDATLSSLKQYFQANDPEALMLDHSLRAHTLQLLEDVPPDLAAALRQWITANLGPDFFKEP